MSLTEEDKDWIRGAFHEQIENLVTLITSVKESLEREIAGVRKEIGAVITRLDNFSARLDRQAGILQAGTRRLAGLDDWAERIDKALEIKDREIAELSERLSRLEKR